MEKKPLFYAITISPKYRLENPDLLYLKDRRLIINHLNTISNHYILFPEFDSNARLHYHGIICLTDTFKLKYLKPKIDSQIGFSCFKLINTFEDHLKYLLYCKKDYGDIIQYDKWRPIIYTRDVVRDKLLQQTYIDLLNRPANNKNMDEISEYHIILKLTN